MLQVCTRVGPFLGIEILTLVINQSVAGPEATGPIHIAYLPRVLFLAPSAQPAIRVPKCRILGPPYSVLRVPTTRAGDWILNLAARRG